MNANNDVEQEVNTNFKSRDKVTIAKTQFAAWVIKAMDKGLLMLDPHAPTVTMTVQGSGMFIVGHTTDDPYVFIGVHDTMMPWFLDMPWIRADVIPSSNRIHLIAQMNADVQLTFIMHEDKGLCQWLTKVDPAVFNLPFRTFITMDNNQIAWSKTVNKRLKFRIIESMASREKTQNWAKPLIE